MAARANTAMVLTKVMLMIMMMIMMAMVMRMVSGGGEPSRRYPQQHQKGGSMLMVSDGGDDNDDDDDDDDVLVRRGNIDKDERLWLLQPACRGCCRISLVVLLHKLRRGAAVSAGAPPTLEDAASSSVTCRVRFAHSVACQVGARSALAAIPLISAHRSDACKKIWTQNLSWGISCTIGFRAVSASHSSSFLVQVFWLPVVNVTKSTMRPTAYPRSLSSILAMAWANRQVAAAGVSPLAQTCSMALRPADLPRGLRDRPRCPATSTSTLFFQPLTLLLKPVAVEVCRWNPRSTS